MSRDKIAHQIHAQRDTPFSWGDHDCCCFAAGVIAEVTGTDYMADFRGRYSTELGAQRVLKRAGFADVGEALDAILGDRQPLTHTLRGDVVLVKSAVMSWPCAALCMGIHAVCPGENGLVLVARTDWIASWRVDYE